MRRLSLFHTIEFALRMKRRFSRPEPMPDIEIPPAAIIAEPVAASVVVTGNTFENTDTLSIADVEAEVTETAAPVIPSHALDIAPINSKIVVVRDEGGRVPILAMPSGEQIILGGDDPAVKLPAGAKIQKTAEGEFLASQLGGSDVTASRVSATAYDAITGFLAHFHPSAA